MSNLISKELYEAVKDVPIEALGLNNRSLNALKRAKIENVNQLIGISDDELLAMPAMGSGSVYDIEKCLYSFLNNLVANNSNELNEAVKKYKEAKTGVFGKIEERYFEVPISELQLSARAYNCLKHADIKCLGDLRDYTEQKLYGVPGMGKDSVDCTINAIESYLKNPTFERFSIEDQESLKIEYYSSESFAKSFNKLIEDIFSSKEKNSMSFFDIWNEVGKDTPEHIVKSCLDRMINEGRLSYSDGNYHYEFISILDAIEVLPDNYKECIQMRLSGKRYDEIGEIKGVTRSRAQQIVAKGVQAVFRGAKGITPIQRVKEDENRELFQKYHIYLDDWVNILKKDELEFRYLAIRYKKGENPLPGTSRVHSKPQGQGSAERPVSARRHIENHGNLDDFIRYYKSLVGDEKEFILYTNEEQYVKDISRLRKRITRELKTKKYISDIRITEHEYEMLRGYLHYAIEMVFKTGIAPDDDVFITAVTNVAIKAYKDGNFWGNFFQEVKIPNKPNYQRSVGTKFFDIVKGKDLACVGESEYVNNILLHCFVSDNYANAYFEFLLNFYRLDLDRDIERLDTDTMRALMDAICSEENVGRTHMLVLHIQQAMAANRRGATIRIRNHMKLLDKFFWDDSFEIHTTHRLNNLMQTWARSSKEMIGEIEAYTTGRRRGAKRYSSPYIAYDDEYKKCYLVIPAQSIKNYETDEIFWKVSGAIDRRLDVELMESVIGYKVLQQSLEISVSDALGRFSLELMTAEGETIKKFPIRETDARFFDNDGYPINSNNIKIGEVSAITKAESNIKSSALYESFEIDGMRISYFNFEFEDILHLPNGHVVIVGRHEITNTIAGKGKIDGAACSIEDARYELYGKLPYLVLRMKSEKFAGTAISINSKRTRISDFEYESFSLDDKTDDTGYYINLASILENENGVYRIAVDVPGGASPHWEFVYIKDFSVTFDEAPYIFEPRGTVLFPDDFVIKQIAESCEREFGVNGYKFQIQETGRFLDFITEINGQDATIEIPVPAFFIKDDDGNWNSNIPAPIWHSDLPDVIELAVPHHKIFLYMNDVFSDSGDSERGIEFTKRVGENSIICDITKFKSYLAGDDFARQIRMRFGSVDENLLTIIVHSKVVSLQIIGNFESNELLVNADISGKSNYCVDIRKGDELIAEKLPLIDGVAKKQYEIYNGNYEVEVFEMEDDDSGFGGEDYYSIGVFNQQIINPRDMSERSFRIIQVEEKDNPATALPLKYHYSVLDLKKTESSDTYNGMMVVKKRFFTGSEIAALPVSVRFDSLDRPNYVWISFVDEYGDDADFLYDTRRQGILQEENRYLKPLVCYRRYTFLDDEDYIYHIDFTDEHYEDKYDELEEDIVFEEQETKIHFKEYRYDEKRKRFEGGTERRTGTFAATGIVFVGDAPLSSKGKMCLRTARINTMNELTKMTKADFAKRSSASIKLIKEIDRALQELGMKFKDMEG